MDKAKIIKLGVAAVALLAALALIVRSIGGGSNEVQAATREVVLECRETGETWTVLRGRIMNDLLGRGDIIDQEVGLSSPHADGAPVAFPQSERVWLDIVAQVNEERQAFRRPGSGRD